MRAKLASICSALALLAGLTLLGGDVACDFDVDDDDIDLKTSVVQSQ